MLSRGKIIAYIVRNPKNPHWARKTPAMNLTEVAIVRGFPNNNSRTINMDEREIAALWITVLAAISLSYQGTVKYRYCKK
jgi:hypothetical protein